MRVLLFIKAKITKIFVNSRVNTLIMAKNWIVKNLVLAAIYIAVLAAGVTIGLKVVTRHGQTVTAPDLTGMSVEDAREAAHEAGVNVKVTDSVFVKRLAAGVVYHQLPEGGATVKKGRSIFVTINSIVPRKVVMPNLYGYSVLEARAELKNRGLSLGRLNYIDDIATNNVLGQKCGGVPIEAGEAVVSGSVIDLTVGYNRQDRTTVMPRLIGLKFSSAIEELQSNYLNAGRLVFDREVKTYADTVSAFVYRQGEVPLTSLVMGSPVTLYLTLDPEKLPKE